MMTEANTGPALRRAEVMPDKGGRFEPLHAAHCCTAYLNGLDGADPDHGASARVCGSHQPGHRSRLVRHVAVALTVTALGGMLAGAGLANAAARRTDDDVAGDRSIATLALLVGLAFGGTFVVTAPVWARLWANPEATSLIRILSIGLVAGSYGSVLAGVARRFGRMGLWAAATLASSLIAMAFGGFVALTTRAAWSLTVMPVTSSVLLALIMLVTLGRRGVPSRRLSGVGRDAAYGAKSLSTSLLTYAAYSLPTWTMSRWLGASTFGSWNRAVVVGQVPLESATKAIQTVIFPKFRWDGSGGEAVRRRWSSLISSAAVVVLPLTALVTPLVPDLIRLLLGPQWEEAGVMAQFVLGATAVVSLSGLLGTALQASNNFRAVWLGQLTTLAVMAGASLAMVRIGSWLPMGIGYLAAALLSHAVQLLSATRSALVDPRLVSKWYSISAAVCLLLGAFGWAVESSGASSLVQLAVIAGLGSCYLAAVLWHRNRIEPIANLMNRDA